MTTRTRSTISVAAVGAIASVTAGGISDTSESVVYHLNSGSSWVEGCFEPCLCPIWYTELVGMFRLTPVSITGTFDTYAITDIEWVRGLPQWPESVTITGSGTYTIFSEVAVQERLELDLSIDGGPVTHFDSGFVVTVAEFPEITAAASVGDLYCYDTLVTIDAGPLEPNPDTNGDGWVNVDDIVNVVLDWGTTGIAHHGDVNASGFVDVDDAVETILAWGRV